MKAATLVDFVEFLDGLAPEQFKSTAVDTYLAEHTIEPEEFFPFVFFREDCYARNLIRRTEHFELLTLAWLPNQRAPIHDHAGQRCWMSIISGELVFRNYAPIEKSTELVSVGVVETHAAGERVYIEDQMGIHCIANASKKPAVSVHLYAGPITKCRIYDEKTKRFIFKELEYFTSPETALGLAEVGRFKHS